MEAFTVQNRPYIIGVQFDNHAGSRLDAAAWLHGDQEWLAQPPKVNPGHVLADAGRLERLMGEQFLILFQNFVKITP